jgi:nucleoside-diphosphate-sugar epimerase
VKVLVTGAGGFLGVNLVSMLLDKGYQVKALDKFYFKIDSLADLKNNPNLEIVRADTRTFDPAILNDVSTVVDLAAIAQPDPQVLIDPALYYGINYLGPVRVATLSQIKGVKRYIFPSTCSVYGVQTSIVNEGSKLNPIDSYAETKAMAEQPLLSLNKDGFTVTIVRFATLYGFSPKMRFDLLLNGMTLSALQNNKIMILGDGEQRRPIVHVKDAARSVIAIIESDVKKVSGEIFNIGSNDQNYKVHEVASLIKEKMPNITFENYGDPDRRSYHVNFDKVNRVLGYHTQYRPADAIKEIDSALKKGLKPIDNHWVIRYWAQISKEENLWPGQ